MENQPKQPKEPLTPNRPLHRPERPGVVEPIIAAGEMRRTPEGMSDIDPLGSYTGLTADGDIPVQDADDL